MNASKKKSRTELSDIEKRKLDELLERQISIKRFHLGSDKTALVRYDKREKMYGGEGVVYLLQMFEPGELVNNRIGAYMILPEKENSAGFHTHGTRKEQELYIVMSGEGKYLEKESANGKINLYPITKGSVTTVRGEAFHSVVNTGEEALIIFVITTNEPG